MKNQDNNNESEITIYDFYTDLIENEYESLLLKVAMSNFELDDQILEKIIDDFCKVKND